MIPSMPVMTKDWMVIGIVYQGKVPSKLAAHNLGLYRLGFLTMLGRAYSIACNLWGLLLLTALPQWPCLLCALIEFIFEGF